MVDEIYIKKIREKYLESHEWAKEKGFINDELIKKQNENDEILAERRGYILNRMAELEHLLNIFLVNYFIPHQHTDSEIWGNFYGLILGKDFFSLHQKIKLFGEIGYHKNIKFNKVFDGLTGILNELKDMRNIVAHGYKRHGTKPEVTFLGSHSFKNIDDNFMNEFSKKFEIAFLSLSELIDSFIER